MKSNVWFCATTAAVVFLLAAAPAACCKSINAAQGGTSLQVPADEVLLDLVVHDKRNRPVLDLRPDQIAVTDNGTPVKLTGLRLVNGRQQDEPLITLLFDRPAIESPQGNAEDADFGLPVSPEREKSRQEREASANFLKGFPPGGFRFAVMDIWGRLQLQQDYTEDHKAINQGILAAIQPGQYGAKVTSNAVEERLGRVAQTGQDASGAAISAQERALARSTFAALQASSHTPKDQQMSFSLACLLALVEAQQSLPGRKAVVYFTSSRDSAGISSAAKTHNDNHAKQTLQSIIGAANRAGVNIYVVRLNGLDASKEMALLLNTYSVLSINSADLQITPASATSSGINGYQVAVAGQFADKSAFRQIASKQGAANSGLEGLDALAKGTGGDSLNAAENLSGPVKELVRDLTTYYEAAYIPPAGDEDGSFHATDVKALRAGLKVRTRTGYVALPRNAGITEPPQAFELPLMALLKRPELPGDVDYRATVLRLMHADAGTMNLLAVEAPVEGLEIREDASTHLATAHVSILANIKDSTGAVIERFSEDIARRWAAEKSAGAVPEFISFKRPFSGPPGAYVLESAILDNNSGKAAASRQAFEIADSPSLPELSQLVLVRSIEPGGADDSQPESLQYGDHRIEPNLYGELPPGVHNMSVFFVAHTDPQSPEPATVKLQVLQGGVALGGAPLTSTLQPGDGFHSVLNSFSINSAASGEYQIKAILTQGGKSAETAANFVLTGDEEAGANTAINEAALLDDPPELAVSAQPADRPSAEELDGILADARKNSMDYGDSLPNLICEQTTDRFEDAHGDGNWKRKDTIVELLTYVDHEESRTPVVKEEHHEKKAVGEASTTGMISAGEFGEALGGIFRPSTKAEFKWTESATLRGEAVEVFEYRVERANSTFSLEAHSGFANAGYHGRIYVDQATHGVRSVTLISDDVPKNYPIRKAAVRINYDYIAINEHDYLLPVSAEVVVGQGKQMLERNNLEFTNFRRFGSTLRIVDDGSGGKKQ